MVDYTTPFASDGLKRSPNSSEISAGFTCGPAPRDLFNWLHYAMQSEVGEVIRYAGLDGTNSDLTQLRQAIQKLIDTALSAIVWDQPSNPIDTSGFLTLSQARARLPIWPVILTSSKTLTVNAGSGEVSLASGQSFLHRGIYQVTTEGENFATSANKVYHLRWRKSGGFALLDLANGTYNPSSLAETHSSFDSDYDDMLIARVVTNSSNVATVTRLKNDLNLAEEDTFETDVDHSTNWSTIANSGLTLNWARTPTISSLRLTVMKSVDTEIGEATGNTLETLKMVAIAPASTVTRYTTGNAKYAYDDTPGNRGRIGFGWYAAAR